MKEKWICDSGIIDEKDILNIVHKFFNEDTYYLVGCTDSYHSGKNKIENFLVNKHSDMLELRVFSEEKELLFLRSRIGQNFCWRITNDEELSIEDYIDYKHFIDINSEKSNETENGMTIMSTGGGKYELPITKDNNVALIRAYVSYNQNGVAKIKDHRICGFGCEKEV